MLYLVVYVSASGREGSNGVGDTLGMDQYDRFRPTFRPYPKSGAELTETRRIHGVLPWIHRYYWQLPAEAYM